MRRPSSRSKSAARLVEAALQARLSASQNVQAGSALAGREAVDVGARRRPVARHEAVDASARARSPRPCPRRAGRRPGGTRRAASSAGSRRAASSRRTATNAPRSASNPSRQTSSWISSRSARQRSTGPSSPNSLDGLDRAVEGDPRHHLRVGEVAARAAHLPDPLVRLAPGRLEELEQRARAPSRRRRRRGPRDAAWCSASSTSPKTSSWNWSEAALPIRTGLEPS